jgi:BirA family biotin operon repressor/biotin-[acetyl-CoA-carboxylase] ligase
VTGPGPSSGAHPTTGGRHWRISHVPVTGSTNADLAAAAASGAPDGTVLVTDEQTAGRGRLGRQWQAPAGSSLMFSALVRPASVPAARRGWVGAILGLAIVDAIRTVGPIRPQLKWPNDVLIGEAQVAGILAELVDDGIVVGSGINLTQTADELPISTATSLALSGARGVRRDDLLTTILQHFGALLADWEAADGDVTGGSPPNGGPADSGPANGDPAEGGPAEGGPANGSPANSILDRYKQNLSTLGRAVTVHLPGDRRLSGIARDITADGLLVVVDEDGASHRFAAGDVVHVRR